VVPQGTPPTAWQDNPTLTPFGLNPFGTPAKTIGLGYLLLSEGAQGTSLVSEDAQRAVLTRINGDLEYLTQTTRTHMPPWTTGQNPHYIDYFLVATGFPNDPNDGGYQGWEGGYPDVVTMPVAMTDDSLRYSLTHEFVHVLQNSYGTINGDQVSWIHESHNDYLMMRLAERELGGTPGQEAQVALPGNVGYLDTLVYEQSYVPIESCGINGQGGVTGPADYFNDSTGFRYNDLFPLFVSQRVDPYFYAAVWEQAQSGEQNLDTMARLLDLGRVKCMVSDYAARLVLFDFAEFTDSIRQRASAEMYTAVSQQGDVWTPTDATKLPRHTGRNNVVIEVDSGATAVELEFLPDARGSAGTPADLRAQLVYRATDGSAVFGELVASGKTTLQLAKAPKNGVVFAVISNVTFGGYVNAESYGWDPNESFGYSMKLTGGSPGATDHLYY